MEKTHGGVWWENLKKSSYCAKEGVDERIILRYMLWVWNWKMSIALIWLMFGRIVGFS
jgi:hypothetical protein